MPNTDRKKGRHKYTNSRSDAVQEDDQEVAQQISLAQEENGKNSSTCSIRIVKLKLNTFLKDENRNKLNGIINRYALLGNRILGEAYALANFHVLRILTLNNTDLKLCFPSEKQIPKVKNVNGKEIQMNIKTTDLRYSTEEEQKRILPVLDRNFFYACLVACSSCKIRNGTLGESLSTSVALFDTVRGSESPKADFIGMTQILSDLSIIMATMTTNHLQMNLSTRISEYVKLNHGKGVKGFVSAIVRSLTYERKTPLETLFPTRNTNPKCSLAMEVATYLRSFVPDDFNPNFANHMHKSLPLYYKLLEVIEKKKEEHLLGIRTQNEEKEKKDGNNTRRRAPRTFNILPTKNSYTIGYVPFSNMTILKILKDMKKESFVSDGRQLNEGERRSVWEKYFNINAVETRTNRFAYRILSDGYGVSIQLEGLSSENSHRLCREDSKSPIDLGREVSVDPGFADIVTTRDNRGKTMSYSSAQYYEDAGFNHSCRKTQKWNTDTEPIIKDIPSSQTIDVSRYLKYVKSYLHHLSSLLEHRAEKGYRKMRFFRYTRKQKAVKQICNLIAPPDEMSVVGFGDWNGGAKSCISRRTSGPIKAIKQELQQSCNVKYHSIDEFRSSQRCSLCHNRLTNMKAFTTRIRRKRGEDGKIVEEKTRSYGRVHKVLHCTSGGLGDSLSCGTTWNRDVNASRNILDFLQMETTKGGKRDKVFCR